MKYGAKCDLCGKEVQQSDVEQLLVQYRVKAIVNICPTCRQWANKIKSDVLDTIAPTMRNAIHDRWVYFNDPIPCRRPWWRRLFQRN